MLEAGFSAYKKMMKEYLERGLMTQLEVNDFTEKQNKVLDLMKKGETTEAVSYNNKVVKEFSELVERRENEQKEKKDVV